MFQSLRWRNIGPHRGGHTNSIAGVPSQPNVFYIGVCNGGVWKSTDYGRTWNPIFDDQPTGSIGALAVAPSDPNVLYVGSGEGLQRPDLSVGDGVYKSTDAGKTWRHMGLSDGRQIASILVDPRDARRLFVAVLGHPYGANAGDRVNGRGSDVAEVKVDPKNPDVVYCANTSAYRSTDGGQAFTAIKGAPGGDDYHRIWINPENPRILLLGSDQGATISVNG